MSWSPISKPFSSDCRVSEYLTLSLSKTKGSLYSMVNLSCIRFLLPILLLGTWCLNGARRMKSATMMAAMTAMIAQGERAHPMHEQIAIYLQGSWSRIRYRRYMTRLIIKSVARMAWPKRKTDAFLRGMISAMQSAKTCPRPLSIA